YDRFVATYGPINKTTFGATADGSVIRRMPNLVKFRQDPDAMLVMSLENYDELTGKATKAAIMAKDVVGKNPPITKVASAAEGLLGDIDANLGAPWIPESDVQTFAAQLFQVEPDSIQIGHLKKDAVWSVEGDYMAQRSVAAITEYGTPRAGGIGLLEGALNM